MALFKSAQLVEAPKDEVILYEERPEPEDVIELHKPEEFSFHLAPLPGSEALEVSEMGGEDEPKEETKKDLEVNDPWDWKSGGLENVLNWAQERCSNLPRHSGRETSGIERVMSCLKRIDNELSKAITEDYDGKVDIDKFEKARKEIHSGIERLEEAHGKLSGKKKKKADEKFDLVKEARTAYTGHMVVSIPILISSLARGLINGTISQGHSIEHSYSDVVKKYSLSDREQMELLQHLEDMGFPMRRDRLLALEEVDTMAGKGELMSNYFA
jgi:hypothetical protein